MKSTFSKIDIDMKWFDSFSDKYKRILIFFIYIGLFFYGESGSYFLYEECLVRIIRESDESLDSIYRIGKISEEFGELDMIEEILTLVNIVSHGFTMRMFILSL